MRTTPHSRVLLRLASTLLGLGCLLATVSLTQASTALAANNNETAYRYFVGKGLTKNQSAGIVGNLMQESGSPINPRATQYPSGPGRGIAQWSVNDRWSTLTSWANASGRDPWALSTQLDFIWREFGGTERSAYTRLKATTTLRDATLVISHYYERCGTCHDENRINYAKQVLAAYGGGAPVTETSLPVLRRGSSGAAVKTLQYVLKSRGYAITADGSFGPATETAVRAFQKARSLSIDGVVGTNTWKALLPTLQLGSTGQAVRGLQEELRAAGYSLAVDGSFGSGTRAAVVAYQRTQGLDPDGIVGLHTWGSLID